MLDLILIALLQAVAGDPTTQITPPAPAAAEAPASAGETPTAEEPAADAPAADAPAADAPAVDTTQYREERVCERLPVATGERMPRRRCRTVQVPIEQPAAQ